MNLNYSDESIERCGESSVMDLGTVMEADRKVGLAADGLHLGKVTCS